jgi:hypothetical protein
MSRKRRGKRKGEGAVDKAIRVAVNGSDRIDLKPGYDLGDESNPGTELANKVVVVIVILALIFIAIMTWFVIRMPVKTG